MKTAALVAVVAVVVALIAAAARAGPPGCSSWELSRQTFEVRADPGVASLGQASDGWEPFAAELAAGVGRAGADRVTVVLRRCRR